MRTFPGRTQEHFGRGLQPCFRHKMRAYEGMNFIVRNYRGYNTPDGKRLQGMEYKRVLPTADPQTVKIGPEVSYLGSLDCKSIREHSPVKKV